MFKIVFFENHATAKTEVSAVNEELENSVYNSLT